MEYHYIYLSYKVPRSSMRFHYGADVVEEFIYDHLREFGCLPRDDNVNKMIKERFNNKHVDTKINLMIRMTDDEAMKSASDRSEYHHPTPEKIDKATKHKLRKVSKRKRSMSEDDTPRKKLKDSRCPICLEDMDTKKNITLECDCVFHYSCIKKWLGCKKVCPTCETAVSV
jgi:hypothetical protein